MRILLLCAAAASVVITEATPLIKVTEPVTWTELDEDKLKGRPSQLAWSDDDTALYLQIVQGVTAESLKYRHYLVRKDSAPSPIDSQPAWAQAYWKWKSAKNFFGDPLLTIEVDTRRELIEEVRDRNTAYLNSEKHAPATLAAKGAAGTRITNLLMLKGHVVGEFVDEQIFPGYTFSWSPEPLRLIAFRSPTGRLTIMNVEGQTDVVGDGKDVWLPAWSESGNQIAYLERTARKKFAIRVMSAL